MKVVVLGAGVVGVATAWYLARAGVSVAVIDRQPGPARETSFANGGQISANHATPWAGPTTPWKVLRWVGRDNAPLLVHIRADVELAAWFLRFLRNCTAARVTINTERALRMALYSRSELKRLRSETGIVYDHLSRGILHIFRNPTDYQEALATVPLMNRLGCSRRLVDANECVAIEQALTTVRDRLVGGIFSPDDESGDAYGFTCALADLSRAKGVSYSFETTICRLVASGGEVAAVETDRGRVEADAFVVACGSYSPQLLKPLGLRLPVVPAKGYSVTIPIMSDDGAPTVSLIDDEFKMVYSRLGNRLRAAGTAEFAGYDTCVREPRARFLLTKAMELFPRCGDAHKATFWAGLRPSTPDGVPVLGATSYSNLFLNTGHGTLGWTMACGSGQVVADLVMGREPAIALDGLGLDRFH